MPFRVFRPIVGSPRGLHYELVVAVGDTLDDECTGIVVKKKFRPRGKGDRVVFRTRFRVTG